MRSVLKRRFARGAPRDLGARFLTATVVALGGVVCGACERQDTSRNHLFLTGNVSAIQREAPAAREKDSPARSLLLTMRLPAHPTAGDDASGREPDLSVTCLLGPETEVYINDRFHPADAIVVGDIIDVFGYRDAGASTERVAARLVYVTRPEPVPPEPDLPLTTIPSTTTQETTPWPTAP